LQNLGIENFTEMADGFYTHENTNHKIIIYGRCSLLQGKKATIFHGAWAEAKAVSFAEVLTIFIAFFLSRRKDFKAFYFGLSGSVLREIFPKMTSYSALLRRLTRVGKIVAFRFANGSRHDVKKAENLLRVAWGQRLWTKAIVRNSSRPVSPRPDCD
jgi:hypothetical protein